MIIETIIYFIIASLIFGAFIEWINKRHYKQWDERWEKEIRETQR